MHHFNFKKSIIISKWGEQTVLILIKKVLFDLWKKKWLQKLIHYINTQSPVRTECSCSYRELHPHRQFTAVLWNVSNIWGGRSVFKSSPPLDCLMDKVANCHSVAWALLMDWKMELPGCHAYGKIALTFLSGRNFFFLWRPYKKRNRIVLFIHITAAYFCLGYSCNM